MKPSAFDPTDHDPFDGPASVQVTAPPERRIGPWTVAALIAGGAGLLGAGVLLGAGLALEVLTRPRDPRIVHSFVQPVVAPDPAPPLHTAVTAPIPSGRRRIEVAFVVDTTGSMGGLLRAARLKAWSIVNALADLEPRPELAMGLVAYRDHGDDYLTRAVSMTRDLDAFYAELASLRAIGGGDRPEAVDAGLREAVDALGWSAPGRPDTTRLIVLMGDAPPRASAPGLVEAARAQERGITVSTLLVGDDPAAAAAFARIAAAGGGAALTLEPTAQGRLAEQVTTPFDAEVAALQRRIEATVIPYGTAAQQRALRAQWALNNGGSLGAEEYASRASAQCKTGGFYAHDLIDAIDAGRVQVPELRADMLPPERAAAFWSGPCFDREVLEPLRRERAAARAALADVVARRDAWLRRGAPQDGLDARLLECVRREGARPTTDR